MARCADIFYTVSLDESENMNFDSIGWSIAKGEYNEKPQLIRFRNFPVDFANLGYPNRLNIIWVMSQAEEWGLPSSQEMGELEIFENRLVDVVESDKHSVLSVVLTGDGKREFVFHTADVEGFLRRLSAMPQEESRYPIEIHRDEDPSWKYVDSVVPDA